MELTILEGKVSKATVHGFNPDLALTHPMACLVGEPDQSCEGEGDQSPQG